jgi:hypothetical protein
MSNADVNDDIIFDGTKRSQSVADAPNTLSLLATALAEEVSKPDVTYVVPGRPGFAVTFDTNITVPQIERLRKACRSKHTENNFDSLKFGCIMIANQSKAILLNGEVQTNVDGAPLTLRSEEIHQFLGVDNYIGQAGSVAIEAVKKFYGYDGHIMNVSGELLTAAGFDSDDENSDLIENPIQPS